MRKFESKQVADAFYDSDMFKKWNASIAPLIIGSSKREVVCGLEAWFTAPGKPFVPPARWRMACITALGVFPLSYFLPIVLQPVTQGWPRWGVVLATTIGIVGCLTWLVMPLLSRIFSGWLRPALAEKAG